MADGGDEAVASAGHGDDVLVRARALSQDLPKDRNVLREAGFFDDSVGPKALEHLLLGEQVALVFDEQQQRIEDLGSNRYLLAVTQQNAPHRVALERAELEIA